MKGKVGSGREGGGGWENIDTNILHSFFLRLSYLLMGFSGKIFNEENLNDQSI